MRNPGPSSRLLTLLAAAVLVPWPSACAGGPITEFPLASTGHRPQAITAGPDGNLWATEVAKHQILRITPDGKITAFPVPGANVGVLQGIAAGPDGNLWFTSREENAIRRVSPQGEFNGTFPIPSGAAKPNPVTKGSWPRGIAPGPDGNLWFTEMAGNKIGRITPQGQITEFDVPTPDAQPYGVVAGPDGRIWFTESGAGKVGRLDPKTGKVEEFALSSATSLPRDIAVGPDGNVWFSENRADQIGRITPAGVLKELPVPTGSQPIGITGAADGNVWFVAFRTAKVGRMTQDGRLTEFALTTPEAKPFGITRGPDGNVWFTEQADRIGRVNLKTLGK